MSPDRCCACGMQRWHLLAWGSNELHRPTAGRSGRVDVPASCHLPTWLHHTHTAGEYAHALHALCCGLVVSIYCSAACGMCSRYVFTRRPNELYRLPGGFSVCQHIAEPCAVRCWHYGSRTKYKLHGLPGRVVMSVICKA